MKLLLASRNAGKLTEMRRILGAAGVPLSFAGLDDMPRYIESPETGLTFADNALVKAREGVAATGLPTVGDDSGLTVDVLHGAPGVFSARWSGRHGDDRANLELLLAQLTDVPDAARGAAFICAVALVWPDGREHVVHGQMRGQLTRAPRGAGGFGYDPIFVPDEATVPGQTSAELTAAGKDAVSHRGKALRALARHLAEAAG